MLCPYCQTENRDDREACYHCSKDISMLRLIVNKAKHHYNQALEHAERGRTDEAITELKNALDLDSSMVNAYVVLGTLHAKKEEFNEAQAVWHQALALDHRYQKVHDYLNKSEPAKVVFPAIRRLKALSVMLGLVIVGLVAVLAIVALGQSRPSGDRLAAQLKNQTLDSMQARNVLDEFVRKPGVDPDARQFADTLRKTIDLHWQEKLDLARAALSQNNPALAMQIADALERRAPDANVLNSIRRTRDLATQQMVQRLEAAAAQFDRGTAAFEEVRPQAAAMLAALPEGPERQQAQALLERLQAQYRARVLAEAAVVMHEAPTTEALRRLSAWRAADPALEADLLRLLDARLEHDKQDLLASARAAQAAGRLEEAGAILRDVRARYAEAARPAPEAELAAAAAGLEHERRTRQLAALEQDFVAKRWEPFLAATENVDALTTDAVERAKLLAQRERAWRGFADEGWAWLEARDGRFDDNSVSPADAARTLQLYPRVLEHLPKPLNYARAALHYYAASANLRLGRKAEARALLEQAQTEAPKQYGAKEAKAFAKRFAKQLE